jgi:mannose-6-phosphate isomerase-like protein (cupin superfamily)
MTPERFRSQFPSLSDTVHLASCSQGAASLRLIAALEEFQWTLRSHGAPWERWMAEVDTARRLFAAFIGASPDEVAIVSCAPAADGGAAVRNLADVERTCAGPGVTEAVMLDDRHGCHGLSQVRRSVTGGATLTGTAQGSGESWYVVGGSATLNAGVEMRAGTAVWLPAGTGYRCAVHEDLELLTVTVRAASPGDERLLVRTLEDCEPERTGDREFRVLLGTPDDHLTITEFVGLIPPGRAPEHRHTYDEVVHVLSGTGVVHLGAASVPIGPGTSVYLPPLRPHCQENTGTTPLVVLGVFHPSGSPAAKRQLISMRGRADLLHQVRPARNRCGGRRTRTRCRDCVA